MLIYFSAAQRTCNALQATQNTENGVKSPRADCKGLKKHNSDSELQRNTRRRVYGIIRNRPCGDDLFAAAAGT